MYPNIIILVSTLVKINSFKINIFCRGRTKHTYISSPLLWRLAMTTKGKQYDYMK